MKTRGEQPVLKYEPIIQSGLNFRSLTVTGNECGISRRFPHPIFRSGNASLISESDAFLLKNQYGVNYYFDLRTPEEVHQSTYPANLPRNGIQWKLFSISGIRQEFRQKSNPLAIDYANYYLGVLEQGEQTIARLMRFIAAHDCVPFIFGCYAGKDRTGVLAYIFLKLMGAPLKTIVRDYCATTPMLRDRLQVFEEKRIKKKIPDKLYQKRLEAKKRTILLFHKMLNEKYGSIFLYLNRIGITNQYIKAIKDKLK